MSYSYVVPAAAVVMIAWTTYHVTTRQTELVQSPPPIVPAKGDYPRQVAAAGVVESGSENIRIGSHYPGVVDAVLVVEGQTVSVGAPLLRLDTRQIDSDIAAGAARLAAAEAQLARLRAMPRPEDVPPVEARRRELQAALKESQDAYERTLTLFDQNVTPEEDLIARRSELQRTQAQLDQATAEEERLKAGAWSADIEVAAAQAEEARAELGQLRTQRDRHTLLAPESVGADGGPASFTVLQVDVRAGEAISAQPGASLIVLGDVTTKHVRADIDEHDIPRFLPGAPATASVRGDGALTYPLRFVRLEPLVVPKKSLTGDSTERVDTRVMQVLYQIDETGQPPVYVGQQMDVFVNTDPDAAVKVGAGSNPESPASVPSTPTEATP